MPRINLLTDAELVKIVKRPAEHSNETVVMAMELLEYRMHYGELGCQWLDTDSGAFTKMVDPTEITGNK
jgi:hypothetical protein